MYSANDSVIICDTPSPAKTTRYTDTVMKDYKRRLRSSSVKSLLSTVYESPLMHFKRNKMPEADTTIELNDVTIVSSPPPKKRKTNRNGARLINLDESVVIVNDRIAKEPLDDPESIVEVGLSDTETNDVVEVPELPEQSDSPKTVKDKASSKSRKKDETAVKQFRIKMPKTMKRGKKKVVNLKNPKKLKIIRAVADSLNVNDENHNGQIMERTENEYPPAANADAADVEVVWVSGPEASNPEAANSDQPFFVDTVPSLTNMVNAINLKGTGKRKKPNRTKKIGSNNPGRSGGSSNAETQSNNEQQGRLREIVIDGPNVGMGHSCGKSFSQKGLKLVIDYFKKRGHVVKAFLPQTMRNRGRVILEKLHKEGTVVFTPSRRIAGKVITPYDDRFILDYATQCNGIVVSSDQYRDLWREKPQWRNTIEKRLLAPTFAGDYLMFPEDPLGRCGPKLDEFLRY